MRKATIPSGGVFFVRREGNFECWWNLPEDTKKCGGATEHNFRYEVTIWSDGVDKDGFTLDNDAIASYFIKKYEHGKPANDIPSCELISAIAAKDFGEILAEHGLTMVRFKCLVWGSGVAFAGYEWEA